MSVIAWDGETLAADRQCQTDGLRDYVTKIYRIGQRSIGGGVGQQDQVCAMLAWVNDPEATVETFPKAWADGEGEFIVIRPPDEGEEGPQVFCFGRTPYPMRLEPKNALMRPHRVAIGSGASIARACMHHGLSAIDSVQTAIDLDTTCGGGIDALTLYPDPQSSGRSSD